eukprot:Plantae.Rhodophyta-Hildenbrandia_rubra.ctg36246.p1 GENE.Plantae.Rhodophyta-Hildenbrandia_rubra.ctg36246~~Plantae.Rhodophyta-Hildenbrandia_rubra.ctg36246.p1  ORF type:complete len:331 (+),score=36.25 Plantae.Rhodophyta-Hildenbrandia_rubra.ctg36246:456-1448(+)
MIRKMIRNNWNFGAKSIIAIVMLAFSSVFFLEREYLMEQMAVRLTKTEKDGPGSIILDTTSLENEGIGAVMSGLRQILTLSDMTGYGIVMKKRTVAHGYDVSEMISFPSRREKKKECVYHKFPKKILHGLQWGELNNIDEESIRELLNCEKIVVKRYLNHPRTVSPRTDRLVRQALEFDRNTENRGTCVLQRAGDVEHKIKDGKGNHWDIDVKRVRPILDIVRSKNRSVTVATETKESTWIRERYGKIILKNGGGPLKLMADFYRCRCLFISAGSSFASLIAQITEPDNVIYMEDREGFVMGARPYNYSKMPNYHMINDDAESMARLCIS